MGVGSFTSQMIADLISCVEPWLRLYFRKIMRGLGFGIIEGMSNWRRLFVRGLGKWVNRHPDPHLSSSCRHHGSTECRFWSWVPDVFGTGQSGEKEVDPPPLIYSFLSPGVVMGSLLSSLTVTFTPTAPYLKRERVMKDTPYYYSIKFKGHVSFLWVLIKPIDWREKVGPESQREGYKPSDTHQSLTQQPFSGLSLSSHYFL